MSHAKLSPSTAERWVVCQESLIEPEGDHYIQDDETEFASDGSAKHKLSDWCLNTNSEPIDALLAEMSFHGLEVTDDMVDAAQVYVDHVRALQNVDPSYNQIWFESRVYIEDVDDDMYGTLDVALFSEAKRHLIVGDAKFGWEIKLAEGNWQLRSYAIGKTRELEDLGYEVERITCFICQPPDEFNPIKTVEYTREQLHKFARFMKQAKKGNAVKAGDHCKRCRRAHICETFDRYVTETIDEALNNPVDEFNRLVTAKTPQEISDILKKQAAVNTWFAALSGWAKQIILLGGEIPDYELKAGKGNRVYTEPDVAEKTLLERYGEGIYAPRKVRSPAQIEKIWGKEAKVLLNGTKEEPGLTHRPVRSSQLVRR